MSAEAIKTILFSGCVFIDELDSNNNVTGEIGSLESTLLTIESTVDEKKIISRQCDTFGQTHASVTLPTGAVCAITLLDQPAKTLAMNLLADTVDSTVAAASPAATDEAVTVNGTLWSKLAGRNIDPGTEVVQDVTDTTTYVEGADYNLNDATGMIRRIEGGGISDGDVLHVDYDTLEYTRTRYTGGTKQQSNVQIRMEATNQVTGLSGTLLIPKVALRPNGPMDFISGEYLANALIGDIVTLSGNSYAFLFDEYGY